MSSAVSGLAKVCTYRKAISSLKPMPPKKAEAAAQLDVAAVEPRSEGRIRELRAETRARLAEIGDDPYPGYVHDYAPRSPR